MSEEKVSEITAITILHYYIIKFFSTILAEELYNPFILHFCQQLHLIENIVKMSERETLASVSLYLFDRVVFSFYLNPIYFCKISLPNKCHWSGVQILIRRLFNKEQLISWFLSLLSHLNLLLSFLLLSDDPLVHCCILSIHPVASSGTLWLRLRWSH